MSRASSPPPSRPVRLQRFLANAGLGSRRSCEAIITAGRVTVDGKTVRELGTVVDPEQQRISVDGRALQAARPLYLALYKPPGYVCSNRQQGDTPRAVDLLRSVRTRLFCVGRLDKDSEGLLLLTNDGELCNRISHPRYGVAKTYRVDVKGEPHPESLERLRHGVWLAEGRAAPARIQVLRRTRERTILLITLREGKNREIRRLLARVGLRVRRLVRVRVGPVRLQGLKRGAWRHLTRDELASLRRNAERPAPPPHPRTPSTPGRLP
ncbi:MAG: pseudouridine synthase [Planctomycetota bacterium]